MSSKAAKLVLKKNKKLDKIYHPETGVVFKSATEKVVIGRIVDDEFIPLDEEALELCEKNHFKYDESLVETEEATEEEKPVEAKKSSKKSEARNSSQEETVEEEEKPATQSKKAVEEEPKVSAVKKSSDPVKVGQSKGNASSDDVMSGFATILSRYNKELQDFFAVRQAEVQKESQTDKERIAELETQVSSLKKELEDVKKKLKGVLTAMQGEL